MKKSLSVILALLIISGVMSCMSAQQKEKDKNTNSESVNIDKKNEEAMSAAKEWLVLIDAREYSESWDNAASLFQKAMTKEQWIEVLNGLLPSYGKLIQREVISSKHYTELPGAPDGEYVVIQFNSSFENKKECIETVTPMKDDGKWKVSGYYIK